MEQQIAVFRSAEAEAQYNDAYQRALELWPVPYQELYVSTHFGETHVIASGQEGDPPLVLFHPAGCGAVIWYRNLGAFSQHFRTYAVDVMGEVNKSRPTRRIANRKELAEWVSELFDGLGIERAHMVGNSFGGFAVLNMALYHPERLRKIVLISPAFTFTQMPAWYLRFFPAYLTGWHPLLEGALAWIWQGFPIDECLAELRHITSLGGVPRHMPPSVFSDQELRRISTPALLLIGDREVVYKPEAAMRRATQLVAGLRAEMVPGANHNAEYTAAAFVNQRVLEFLCDS